MLTYINEINKGFSMKNVEALHWSSHDITYVDTSQAYSFQCVSVPCSSTAGSSVVFSPGNLSTSSSASSTLGSPENEEYILSFETIDKMRRVSSYSSLNSLIGEPGHFHPMCRKALRNSSKQTPD